MYGFPGLESFDSDTVDSLAAEHFVRTGSTISSPNSRHHLRRPLHILLIAVNLATFVIVHVLGQTSIAHIGVRGIGADVMVLVPLESQGGEAKEGEENDALSVAASFGFEASLT